MARTWRTEYTETILSQFGDQIRHIEKKFGPIAEEEKRLWKNLKHGMILETTEFVKKLRDNFPPCSVQKKIPQQLKIRKDNITLLNQGFGTLISVFSTLLFITE